MRVGLGGYPRGESWNGLHYSRLWPYIRQCWANTLAYLAQSQVTKNFFNKSPSLRCEYFKFTFLKTRFHLSLGGVAIVGCKLLHLLNFFWKETNALPFPGFDDGLYYFLSKLHLHSVKECLNVVTIGGQKAVSFASQNAQAKREFSHSVNAP